jgi:hypothetical protein
LFSFLLEQAPEVLYSRGDADLNVFRVGRHPLSEVIIVKKGHSGSMRPLMFPYSVNIPRAPAIYSMRNILKAVTRMTE